MGKDFLFLLVLVVHCGNLYYWNEWKRQIRIVIRTQRFNQFCFQLSFVYLRLCVCFFQLQALRRAKTILEIHWMKFGDREWTNGHLLCVRSQYSEYLLQLTIHRENVPLQSSGQFISIGLPFCWICQIYRSIFCKRLSVYEWVGGCVCLYVMCDAVTHISFDPPKWKDIVRRGKKRIEY